MVPSETGGEGIVCKRWLALAAATLLLGADSGPRDRFDTVVIDAGHGGPDRGAHGSGELIEKDLVLDVARRLGLRLRAVGLRVVLTREVDAFVSLETRTAIANDARGDLLLSIHANAARTRKARGMELYFLSASASDEAASQLARRENQAFETVAVSVGPPDDALIAILSDMISNEHSRESAAFARMAYAELDPIDPDASRGVKQAPFVGLSGLQMPAVLVEIGFLTNQDDERELRTAQRREEIVESLTRAVLSYGRRYDAKRGIRERGPSADRGR